MKKLILLVLAIAIGTLVHAELSYPISLAGKNFTCKTDTRGLLCQLSAEDPLYGKITIERPYTIPGSVELNEEKENLKTFMKEQGYTLIEQKTDSRLCVKDDGTTGAHFVVSTGINKQNKILQIISRIDNDTVTLFLYGFENITEYKNAPISIQTIAEAMCPETFPTDHIFVFNKWFTCNRIEEDDKETAKFTCKLDEKDPQYKTLFGEKSYITDKPIFPHPKKELKGMLKAGCTKQKIVSCPKTKNVVGICIHEGGETFLHVIHYGFFAFTNTDLKNSMADKEHAQQFCNIRYNLAL